MSGQHVQCGLHYRNLESSVLNAEVICWYSTFSVVVATKTPGLNVQCSQYSICHWDIESSI